ncbi:protein VACUOLELESS1 isoform X2 [Amborella trichopoda]|uniref:protein VACUOLELESS1 isoform X2 n=1 Tax=Amborella trichopoda TaxID=13333 RepID=UPI0009BE8D60|nr:protein VACUOLELESS1 isoform X2 [Amborella trichopoda]|eukprot:XP_020529347.1 protein VACUOLELESS1 isoform X2 [Amborella trichopoda]
MSVSVAAEWQILSSHYYQKPELYSMCWRNMDLSRHKLACAPFGGPIAALRDESKIIQLLSEPARRKLQIFNAAGIPLASTVWDRPGGRLVAMAWTDHQTLACLVQDGTLFFYDIHAHILEPSLSMGRECREQNVVECVFWGNGVVCLTEGNLIFCVPDLKDLRPCKFADPGLEEPPLCMAVIEPKHTMSGNVEVLLAVEDYILVVEEDVVQRVGEGLGPIQKMAVSPHGKYLAAFTHIGKLVVLSMGSSMEQELDSSSKMIDFSTVLLEYDCETALPPEHLTWCGLYGVLLCWDDTLLMVGSGSDAIKYSYDEPIILIPECDGVRILSNSSMEFLQRVTDSTLSIFKIGSTLPAALLYDALDHFDKHSAKADENLRLIRSSLPAAVEACIDAAGHEYDISRQRTLLRAACYGRAFCSQFQRDRFQEMCKTLRVLNAVRNHEIGVPLSIEQYKEVVIMHWACVKITASAGIQDVALLDILLDKLKICKDISYAAVAAHANQSGRRKLAAMLVEYEPRSSEQVPLLLSMGEEDRALSKATESGDTDLVYLILFHSWPKKSPLEFFGMIQMKPLARDLFISYARCYKHEFLKDFYLSAGMLHDLAFLLWRESWEQGKNPLASKGSPIHGPRIKLVEQAHNLFSETKEHAFESKAAEEHAKLLRVQHELEVSTKRPLFVDSSVSDTIRTCITLGYEQAAAKVRAEFKVPEKRWYWLKLLALAAKGDWDGLEKFSKEKRPPIGYKPFVEACIDADAKGEALKYIPKLTDPREKAEFYARIGMAKEAADAASQAKDGELLIRLKQTFSQNAAATAIFDTLRDRLSLQGVS